MKFTIVLLLLFVPRLSLAQQFPVDTIRFHGDPNTHINIVILGDGYTASEQSTFLTDARGLSDYLLSQSPWSHYADYFNVFAIEAPSQESGTSHPNTAPDCSGTGVPVIAVNTRFNCTFDAYGIHRLVVPQNQVAISQTLSANFPDYDQVLMVAHSPYYGGSGGAYATASVNTASDEIVAHEIGHSFAGLADEYWAGPQYAAEKPNMTKESSRALVRWKNWMSSGLVDVYPYSGDPTWFKPSENCKMQALNNPYCAVCSEAIIERIHTLTNPIVAYQPVTAAVDLENPITFSLDTLIAPVPNTLRTTWTLDGAAESLNKPSFVLDPASVSDGAHTVSVAVLDTSNLVRLDSHFTDHVHTVTWNVTKTNALVIESKQNAITLSAFPNPAIAKLNISVDCEHAAPMHVSLISEDGRVVAQASTGASLHFDTVFNLNDLPAGAYSLVLKSEGATVRRGIIKD